MQCISRDTILMLSGVRPSVRPSVTEYISETTEDFFMKFYTWYLYHHISRPFFFFSKYLISDFLWRFYVFVNMGPYGEKIFKEHLLRNHQSDSLPKNHGWSWGGSLPKLLKEFWNFEFCTFDKFFSFLLTQDHMGEKVSNDISSETTSQNHSQKIMDDPRECPYQSC